MEEKMLRITKYNIIQRIQKKLLIRRLNKHKNFDDWRKSSLKDDPEVMAIAWELASNEQYKEFPVGKQIEMFDGYNPEIISYLSLEAQIKIFEFNKGSTEFFSDDALQIVIKNNPNNFRYLTDRNKDQLIKQEDFIKGIMPNLPHSDQETIVSKKPHFILSCSKEIRERILRFKGLSSPEWQAVLTQEKKLSLSKLIKYMSYS